MSNLLDFDDFKFLLGETMFFCQTIEHDVKWTYAIIKAGSEKDNFQKIIKWSLGQTIEKLETLDNSDNKPFLSSKDYQLLRGITEERNYLCHQIYRDFIYQDNWGTSQEYLNACQRLITFHDQVDSLNKSIENARLLALKQFRGKNQITTIL
jgi:hypothetical protein